MTNNVTMVNVFLHVCWMILVLQQQNVMVTIIVQHVNVHPVTLAIHLISVKGLNVHMILTVRRIVCVSTSIVSIRARNNIAFHVLQTLFVLPETMQLHVDAQTISRWEIQLPIANVYHPLSMGNQNVKSMLIVPVVLRVSDKNVWIHVKKLNLVQIVPCAQS